MKLLLCLLALSTLAVAKFLPPKFIIDEDDFSSSSEEEGGGLWAVLVAGSNGWYNYRHQADVAHSYHILLSHGVPAENIIVMMYDDIANNKQNPYPGKLFNSPAGKDVYAGVKIDYKGNSVNPSNFLNILKGNSSGVKGGNGRVVESGPDDRIFVYFTDHGSVGLISFPDGILTVKDLNDALFWMHQNRRHKHLAFYLEACESGSMFEKNLKDNIDVYAVSAANGQESSWGTYCDNKFGLPCLGDLFSVNWMEDSDIEDLTQETLAKQFQLVKKETTKSHVMNFGDMGISKEPVADFQGAERTGRSYSDKRIHSGERLRTAVEAHDVELEHLRRLMERTDDAEDSLLLGKRINDILEERAFIRRVFKKLVSVSYDRETDSKHVNQKRRQSFFTTRDPVLYPECHDIVVKEFHKFCLDFNKYPYAMKYGYVLNNLCNTEMGDDVTVVNGIANACFIANPRLTKSSAYEEREYRD